MKKDSPSPPSHLREATRDWWKRVSQEYDLEEHHLRLLTLAAEAYDRCEQARQILAEAGPVYQDRFGQPRAHPMLAVERDSRLAFARLLREMCLDLEPIPEARKPRRGGTDMRHMRRRKKARNSFNTPRTRDMLLSGHDFEFLDGAGLDEDDLRAAWEELREELIDEHTAEYPDSLPWGSRFDAEPRPENE
jgi:P27 family predicted phage terminase small subunit